MNSVHSLIINVVWYDNLLRIYVTIEHLLQFHASYFNLIGFEWQNNITLWSLKFFFIC